MFTKNIMINIDVILITYNQEKFVSRALESILMQHVTKNINVRIIVADDCSNDNTLDIIKSYESYSPYPLIYLTNKSNLGISKNYERAFRNCSGDYVAILEGDDYWLENHLIQHVKFLEKHKKYSMTINRFSFLKKDRIVPQPWPYIRSSVSITTEEQILHGNQLGNLSACVFRNTCLQKVPDEIYSYKDMADWELGILVSEYGIIGKLKDCTSVYRINENGEWTNLDSVGRFESRMSSINVINNITNNKYKNQFSLLVQRIIEGGDFSITKTSNYDELYFWLIRKIKKVCRLCLKH